VIGLLLAVYPASWRRRYGEEFRAVLESRPLGPFDVADVLLGALDARLMPRRHAAPAGLDGGHVVLLRIGGLGGVIGGILYFLGIAGASGTHEGAEAPWLAVAAAGALGLLAALVGLSSFQAHRNPKLAWAAFLIPSIGTLAMIIGMAGMAFVPDGGGPFIGSWTPWSVWIVGFITMIVGSIMFAVATVRAGVLSRRAAQALAASAVALIVVGFSGIDAGNSTVGALVVAGALGAFSLSWVMLGASALRRGPIIAIRQASNGAGA